MWQGKKWFLTGLLSLVIFLTLIGWVGQVQSQEKYPTRAIDILVPFAPGGGTDLQARVVSVFLNKKWGVPINVLNKPGGNTIPAALEVLKATPDGYTVFYDSMSSTSALVVSVKNLPFRIIDRTFICGSTCSGNIYFVSPTLPAKNLKEVESIVKKDPGNFKWVSMGGAGGTDISMKKFFQVIGVDISKTRPVLAQGLSQAINLVAGGNAMMSSGSIGSVQAAHHGGMVRAVGIGAKERWPDLPDVPTTAELGYSNIAIVDWKGVTGPLNLPPLVVNKWNEAISELLKDPEFISKLKNIGASPFYHNPDDFKRYVMNEIDDFEKLFGLK